MKLPGTKRILIFAVTGLFLLALAIFEAWQASRCVEGRIFWGCQNTFLLLFSVIAFGLLGALFLGNAVGDFVMVVLGQPITYMPSWTLLPIAVVGGIVLFFVFVTFFRIR